MTTKNEIIDWIASTKTVERILGKHIQRGCTINSNDRKDFQQEIYMILLDMPDDKIIKLFNDGTLVFYILTIVRNQLYNKRSQINVKLGRNLITQPLKIEENEEDGSMFDEYE